MLNGILSDLRAIASPLMALNAMKLVILRIQGLWCWILTTKRCVFAMFRATTGCFRHHDETVDGTFVSVAKPLVLASGINNNDAGTIDSPLESRLQVNNKPTMSQL